MSLVYSTAVTGVLDELYSQPNPLRLGYPYSGTGHSGILAIKEIVERYCRMRRSSLGAEQLSRVQRSSAG